MSAIADKETFTSCTGLTATLYCGDCMDILPELSGVDAVITDPPYGIHQANGMGGGGFDSTGKYARKPRSYAGDWDDEPPSAELLKRVISVGRVAVLWGGNYMPLERGGKWLVWNKEQVMPTYSDAELAWSNIDGVSVRLYTLHCNKARPELGLHPTQKPVELMAWCMDQAKTPQFATVLDPFMGSGTTGIACLRTGRNFIGIEKDAGYFKIACERFAREIDGQLL